MRKALLAALTGLLAGHGLAYAQNHKSYPVAENLPDQAQSPWCYWDSQASCGGWWGSGEYLHWWLKSGRVPPLVTAGGDGVLGSPGTRVVVDSLDFVDDHRNGGRFTLGYDCVKIPGISLSGSYFFLDDGQSETSISSSGAPVVGRPYVNAVTGLPAATLISMPGVASGTVAIDARTSFSGAEANLATDLGCVGASRLTVFAGCRYLFLEDQVTICEHFLFAGNTVDLVDDFRTVNRFYGGQVGVATSIQMNAFSLDLRGKIGVGTMQQVAYLNGATNAVAPDGSTSNFQGGLLALRSNIGRHERSDFAIVPELSIHLGWQVTEQLKILAGYSLLWVSTVARAGEQMDPVVNISQFPILSGDGPLVGSARPAFDFVGSDFWAQGLSFGVELKY